MEMYSPAAMENAPASRPAQPANRVAQRGAAGSGDAFAERGEFGSLVRGVPLLRRSQLQEDLPSLTGGAGGQPSVEGLALPLRPQQVTEPRGPVVRVSAHRGRLL